MYTHIFFSINKQTKIVYEFRVMGVLLYFQLTEFLTLEMNLHKFIINECFQNTIFYDYSLKSMLAEQVLNLLLMLIISDFVSWLIVYIEG